MMSGSFICYVSFHGYEVDGDDDNDGGTDTSDSFCEREGVRVDRLSSEYKIIWKLWLLQEPNYHHQSKR